MKHGYARRSTAKQALDAQVTLLTQLGADTITKETGSGRKSRHLFNTLTERLQTGDTLIVTEISRLGRNDIALLKLREDLTNRGITLQVGAKTYDFEDQSDWLAYSLQAVIYAAESRTNGARVKRARAARTTTNKQGGRPKALTAQQETWVRKQYAEGKTYKELCKRWGVSKTTIQRILTAGRTTATTPTTDEAAA